MNIRIHTKKINDRYELVDASIVDRSQLAKKLTDMGYKVSTKSKTVSTALVSYWIKSGKFPADVLPYIKKIKTMDVVTRKRKY